jgi:predicted phosphoribosyltransferase
LVSDGLHNALSLEIAAYFMHTIDLKKLVIATPIASGQAVDKMHISVDQIFCLRSVENYISTNHYYDKNDIPDDKTVVDIMQNIVLNWQHP